MAHPRRRTHPPLPHYVVILSLSKDDQRAALSRCDAVVEGPLKEERSQDGESDDEGSSIFHRM
jgi:hypothetical protein